MKIQAYEKPKTTERRDRMVDTPDSYWGGSGFKSRLGDGYHGWDFRGFSQSLQEKAV
jgi:hypothetical protein